MGLFCLVVELHWSSTAPDTTCKHQKTIFGNNPYPNYVARVRAGFCCWISGSAKGLLGGHWMHLSEYKTSSSSSLFPTFILWLICEPRYNIIQV